MQRIGVIGLGRMGSAIAQRLMAQGCDVTGWTRSARTVAGVASAADLATLTAQIDVLILSLLDDAAVAQTLDGLLALPLSGKLIIDTSTVAPDILNQRIAAIEAAGASAVDAPVSGGPDLVLAGKCGVFIGGTDSAAAQASATLAAISGRVFHVGPLGTGLVMKVINNAMLQVYFGGLDEVMPMARRAGLPLETALRILCGGPAGVPMLTDRLPKVLGDDPSVGFAISAALKDNDVFQRVVQSFGLPSPMLEHSAAPQRQAIDEGRGESDVAALIKAAYDRG